MVLSRAVAGRDVYSIAYLVHERQPLTDWNIVIVVSTHRRLLVCIYTQLVTLLLVVKCSAAAVVDGKKGCASIMSAGHHSRLLRMAQVLPVREVGNSGCHVQVLSSNAMLFSIAHKRTGDVPCPAAFIVVVYLTIGLTVNSRHFAPEIIGTRICHSLGGFSIAGWLLLIL